MAVTDFFAGEIATELIKQLFTIGQKAYLSKAKARHLIETIDGLLPIIYEAKFSGVELPAYRQRHLDDFSQTLLDGRETAEKASRSKRWNVYKNLQLARKMEKLLKKIMYFLQMLVPAHLMADLHHMRVETGDRFDRVDESIRRVEQQLGDIKIHGVGGGGWLGEAVKRAEEEEDQAMCEGSLVNLVVGKRKVIEMVVGRDDLEVVGISGIGGSGKTTLAREICNDYQVQSYFNKRVFLTVSQSPNVEQLRQQILKNLTGNVVNGFAEEVVPQGTLKYDSKPVVRTLVVLDDVWSLSVLERLIFRVRGCKTLVVSRSTFSPTIVGCTHKVELLGENEAMSLFCYSAFGQKSMPLGTSQKLVEQVVEECKGLPLALKVIGSLLRDQPEMVWTSAKNRLLRGQPISESHETQLLERMKLSIDYLPEKVRECFLDLGAFPEDKRIPLDVLINIWAELHDIEEVEAFAIVCELSDKNLLNLVKDPRAGDMYSSYFEISVSQHDVLRDLAIHLSNHESVNKRKRLLMPRRETELPKEWNRHMDQPFNAQIVSLHTGEMTELDWFDMEFPKAEVLIINFFSGEYFVPHFINNMPKLRALVLINYSSSNAILHNIPVFSNLTNLKSLWFEKICVPQLPETSTPLKNLKKISLVLCKISNSLEQSHLDMPLLFPRLEELTMDYCIDLPELPPSICLVRTLKNLSITNCDSLVELPADLGKLKLLEILRICACPNLEELPPGISGLMGLKYIDISQCINMTSLPEEIGGCLSMEKIDMRECPQIKNLPKSIVALRSLRRVVCDKDISWQWEKLVKAMPNLCVQIAQESFDLNFLAE